MRFMKKDEIEFLESMLKPNPTYANILNKIASMQVEDANDGGMGGLIFHSGNNNRRLGKDIAKIDFNDKDGTKVFATLSLDNYGDLYELDIWKTDFSRLINFP